MTLILSIIFAISLLYVSYITIRLVSKVKKINQNLFSTQNSTDSDYQTQKSNDEDSKTTDYFKQKVDLATIGEYIEYEEITNTNQNQL